MGAIVTVMGKPERKGYSPHGRSRGWLASPAYKRLQAELGSWLPFFGFTRKACGGCPARMRTLSFILHIYLQEVVGRMLYTDAGVRGLVMGPPLIAAHTGQSRRTVARHLAWPSDVEHGHNELRLIRDDHKVIEGILPHPHWVEDRLKLWQLRRWVKVYDRVWSLCQGEPAIALPVSHLLNWFEMLGPAHRKWNKEPVVVKGTAEWAKEMGLCRRSAARFVQLATAEKLLWRTPRVWSSNSTYGYQPAAKAIEKALDDSAEVYVAFKRERRKHFIDTRQAPNCGDSEEVMAARAAHLVYEVSRPWLSLTEAEVCFVRGGVMAHARCSHCEDYPARDEPRGRISAHRATAPCDPEAGGG